MSKDARQDRARVEAARRRLDALLVDLMAEEGPYAPPAAGHWPPDQPPPLCTFQALRILKTRWRGHAELLREAVVVYRIAVSRAMSRHGATLVRGWLDRASHGCADATDPGGCPVPGSPLAGLPCSCYVPGWCEHRFLGHDAPVPRAPEPRHRQHQAPQRTGDQSEPGEAA